MYQKIGIIENYKKCILQKYAKINGRASRQEFWKYLLVSLVISTILSIIIYLIESFGAEVVDFDYSTLSPVYEYKNGFVKFLSYLFTSVLYLYYLVTFMPSASVTIRRLHDINKSALVYVLFISTTFVLSAAWLFGLVGLMIMIFGAIIEGGLGIYFFVLLCLKGTEGDNKYGKNPYDEVEEVVEKNENLNTEKFSKIFGKVTKNLNDLNVCNSTKCTSCGSILNLNAKFCPNCGAEKKELKCICGEKIKEDDNFCPSCGKKIEKN